LPVFFRGLVARLEYVTDITQVDAVFCLRRIVEYKKRHDEIWPELAKLLTQPGIHNYLVQLYNEPNLLFGYLERRYDHSINTLPYHPMMKKQWDQMKDIMGYNRGGTPMAIAMSEMLHME